MRECLHCHQLIENLTRSLSSNLQSLCKGTHNPNSFQEIFRLEIQFCVIKLVCIFSEVFLPELPRHLDVQLLQVVLHQVQQNQLRLSREQRGTPSESENVGLIGVTIHLLVSKRVKGCFLLSAFICQSNLVSQSFRLGLPVRLGQ